MPRILLADDHPKVRRHVRDALETLKGWEVCGEASTGREAVAMTEIYTPDIVVLDLSMPELNGLEAAREITKRFPQTVVFILTMHDAHELIREVLAAGARACLTKSNLQLLINEVQNVHKQLAEVNSSLPPD
jgi:DNA-binding NarL/FixJ family response regulator